MVSEKNASGKEVLTEERIGKYLDRPFFIIPILNLFCQFNTIAQYLGTRIMNFDEIRTESITRNKE